MIRYLQIRNEDVHQCASYRTDEMSLMPGPLALSEMEVFCVGEVKMSGGFTRLAIRRVRKEINVGTIHLIQEDAT